MDLIDGLFASLRLIYIPRLNEAALKVQRGFGSESLRKVFAAVWIGHLSKRLQALGKANRSRSAAFNEDIAVAGRGCSSA